MNRNLILNHLIFRRYWIMNKKELTIVLQCCIFAFDGATEKEILELNSHFDKNLVLVGIKLSNHLKNLKVEVKNQ